MGRTDADDEPRAPSGCRADGAEEDVRDARKGEARVGFHTRTGVTARSTRAVEWFRANGYVLTVLLIARTARV